MAETLGWTAERVRAEMSAAELCEWSVYLNSPFSQRSREALMNGWLVHTIRSIVAPKNRKPKLTDSIFPFDKMYKRFFVSSKPKKPSAPGAVKTIGEAAYLTQVLRKRYEQSMSEYRQGRKPNRFGLYKGERIRE